MIYVARSRRNGTDPKYKNATITYGRCCIDEHRCQCGPGRAKHPMEHKNLQPDFIRSAVQKNALFARKFKPKVEDGGGWQWWMRLWDQSAAQCVVERCDEMTKIAKFCHWSSLLRDVESKTKPTSRQQVSLLCDARVARGQWHARIKMASNRQERRREGQAGRRAAAGLLLPDGWSARLRAALLLAAAMEVSRQEPTADAAMLRERQSLKRPKARIPRPLARRSGPTEAKVVFGARATS